MLGMARDAAANPTGAQAKAFERIKAAAGEVARATPEGQLAAAQAEATTETLKHPAMGVLQRILNAGDTVPFKDAHLWKVELDNAIRNTRDQTVKSQVASLTQKFTGSLREALRGAGHAPYEAATAAYAKIAPLYTKGVAPRLRKLAVEEPEAIVRLLNPNQPTKARMLVDLLTTQAAEGGDEAAGRQALEAVQSAWVYQNIVRGGIEKLGDRLAKIPQAFKDAFLSGPKAEAVLDNLQLIHTAFQTAVLTGEHGVEAATRAGKAGVASATALASERTAGATAAGQQTMTAARGVREGIIAQTREHGAAAVEQAAQGIAPAGRALREGKVGIRAQEQALAAQQTALGKSSLAPTLRPEAGIRAGADLLRVGAMAVGAAASPLHSIWSTISLFRLLKGPTAADLVHWAALSPTGTRAFVKAITSPVPGPALAALARSSGILGDSTDQPVRPARPAHQPLPARQPVGGPPPARVAQVGSPPPQ